MSATESIDVSDITKNIALTPAQMVNVKDIFYDTTFNCRGDVTHSSVIELAKDIEARGLMDAITIRPLLDGSTHKYSIVCGHRRYRAHQFLKREQIAAKVIRLSDSEATRINILENVHREPLTFLQEGIAVKALHDLHHSVAQISGFLQKSTTWVRQRLALMDLPQQAHELARLGYLKPTHVFDISKIPSLAGKFKFLRDLKDRSRKIASGELLKNIIERKQNARKTRPHDVRKITEINDMQDIVHSVFGPSIYTRLLGWAAGWLSDDELYEAIKEEADLQGKFFVIPTEAISAVG